MSVELPGGEVLREVDVAREGTLRLVSLREAVYGRPADPAMIAWEYMSLPGPARPRVFTTEDSGMILAATTRLPARLLLRGVEQRAYFNIDSMVHPSQRRKGWMRQLYKAARSRIGGGVLFFSKGSSAQIHPLLVSIGHVPLTPSTYLVSYPSATRWLLSRLNILSPTSELVPSVPPGFEDHRFVNRFGPDFDAFFARVARGMSAIFHRDAAYMNWRYVDIPHRRYLRYAGYSGDQMVSLVILSFDDGQARVVDVLWDPAAGSEPLERAVKLAEAVCADQGVVRVVCFATHPELREVLLRGGFYDRGETPRFSAFIPEELSSAFRDAMPLHVTDGDGDTEFS